MPKNIHAYVFWLTEKNIHMYVFVVAGHHRPDAAQQDKCLHAGSIAYAHGCKWPSEMLTCRHSEAQLMSCAKTTDICAIAFKKNIHQYVFCVHKNIHMYVFFCAPKTY